MSKPKNHHYIPIFYTKRWAGTDGLVCQFFKKNGRLLSKRIHPSGTGYGPNLYSLLGFSPELSQQVETKFFSPVDGRAAEALSLLEKGDAESGISEDLRLSWAQFIMSLLFRCPEDIETARKTWEHLAEHPFPELERHYQANREPHEPATALEYVRSLPTARRERIMFNALMKTIEISPAVDIICEMDWWVVDLFDTRFELFASDRPVSLTGPLENNKTLVVMPLGPRKAFIAGRKGLRPASTQTKDGRETLAKELNQNTVTAATRFAYATTATQTNFAKKYFGTRPAVRFTDALARRAREGLLATLPNPPADPEAQPQNENADENPPELNEEGDT